MNLYKVALSLLLTAAPVSARAAADNDEKYLRTLEMSMPSADDGGAEVDPNFVFDKGGWWNWKKEKEVTLELYLEADNAGQGIATGWLGQQTFCNNQGKRLCKLDELCQARGYYAAPFTQAFTANLNIPAVVSGADNWIAYETNDDTRQDNCGVYGDGGCSLNAWIQIGNRPNSQDASQVCNTHCEVVTDANLPQLACPAWGLETDQSFIPTVAACCDDHE